MGTNTSGPPYPAPPGYEWIFVPVYRHKWSKKLMVASAYGYKSWCFLVKTR